MKTAERFDIAEYLESEEDMAAYLNAALEDGDPAMLSVALGDIARAKGMTKLSRETGISRDGLYKALSPTGNPSFLTVKKVLDALGIKMEVSSADKQDLICIARKPTHPGEVLREEYLPELGLSVSKLAESIGVSRQTINELVRENCSLSPDLALRLARFFGTSAQYWLNMQRNVDLWESLNINQKAIDNIVPFQVQETLEARED